MSEPASTTVSLEQPIPRESGHIGELTLRKPTAGELRGLSLQDLLRADVGAIITVLPRIAQPFITDQEASGLSAPDIAEIGGTIVGFFMTAAQKEAMGRLLGG